jgi:tetratricopeptide (TPR) repeat protein
MIRAPVASAPISRPQNPINPESRGVSPALFPQDSSVLGRRFDLAPPDGIDDQVHRLPLHPEEYLTNTLKDGYLVGRDPAAPVSDRLMAGASNSAAMQTARSQAREAIERGFFLANRGATFSAQAEFCRAIDLIAQARDVDEPGGQHAHDFQDGLAALREAEDYAAVPSVSDGDALRVLSASHRTPVLRRMEHAEALTVHQAAGLYATYAQEKLLAAVGLEPIGSVAMVGLGKTLRTIEHRQPELDLIAAGQAAACYQAALQSDANNFHAAHELGTLLANLGVNEEASTLLNRAISIHPTSETWSNLAVVYQRMGQTQPAATALQQATRLGPTQIAKPQLPRVVDPKTFAASGRGENNGRQQPATTAFRPSNTSNPIR